eukprot:364577-Chlamydomonas_euryale.AAC.29
MFACKGGQTRKGSDTYGASQSSAARRCRLPRRSSLSQSTPGPSTADVEGAGPPTHAGGGGSHGLSDPAGSGAGAEVAAAAGVHAAERDASVSSGCCCNWSAVSTIAGPACVPSCDAGVAEGNAPLLTQPPSSAAPCAYNRWVSAPASQPATAGGAAGAQDVARAVEAPVAVARSPAPWLTASAAASAPWASVPISNPAAPAGPATADGAPAAADLGTKLASKGAGSMSGGAPGTNPDAQPPTAAASCSAASPSSATVADAHVACGITSGAASPSSATGAHVAGGTTGGAASPSSATGAHVAGGTTGGAAPWPCTTSSSSPSLPPSPPPNVDTDEAASLPSPSISSSVSAYDSGGRSTADPPATRPRLGCCTATGRPGTGGSQAR